MTIYRPGDHVPASGIYNIVNRVGTYMGRQTTEIAGNHFEPVRIWAGEYGYTLHRQTVHLGR